MNLCMATALAFDLSSVSMELVPYHCFDVDSNSEAAETQAQTCVRDLIAGRVQPYIDWLEDFDDLTPKAASLLKALKIEAEEASAA